MKSLTNSIVRLTRSLDKPFRRFARRLSKWIWIAEDYLPIRFVSAWFGSRNYRKLAWSVPAIAASGVVLYYAALALMTGTAEPL